MLSTKSLERAYLKAQNQTVTPEAPCWPVMNSFPSFVYAAIQNETAKRGVDVMEELRSNDPDLFIIAERGRKSYFEVLAWRRAHGMVPPGTVEFAVRQDGGHDPRRAPGTSSFEFQPIKEADELGFFVGL